jgi:hypothetical protein
MSSLLQTILVIAIIAACAAWQGWRAWRTLAGRRSGCGCAECPAVKRHATAPVPAPVPVRTSA